MKMVKSLLLGSAAGLVAVAGAQAADLPVKAKPVEYVKVCSIYGAGFFYIPGTDTCIKIGGWVRAEYAFGPTGNSHNVFVAGGGARDNRVDSTDSRLRARTVVSLDVRTQTEYGTLRAYNRMGFTNSTLDSNTGVVYYERAFLQFAGFTFGKTQSYWDFVAGAFCYGCGYGGHGSQTGAGGTLVFAYTANLGGGLSLSIAAEDGTFRRVGVYDATVNAQNALPFGAVPGPTSITDSGSPVAFAYGDYAAHQIPDIVASLRVDQAWGSAQIMAALHQIRGGWYGNNSTGAGAGAAAFTAPSDTFGFAIGGGIMVNLPWSAGDRAYIEGAYTEGAVSYAGLSGPVMGATNVFQRFNGANLSAAWAMDSIFGTGVGTLGTTGHQLTKAWFIGAGIEHYWTPSLRTSVFGNYTSFDYNGTATALFCLSGNTPIVTVGGAALAGAAAGCNPDFAIWNVGTRTIWNPAPMFDIGLEVMYTRVEQKMDSTLVRWNFPGAGGRAVGLYAPSNEGVWSSILRLQRNFWP